ncbi:MAG: EpsG family protein [archaeon]
MIIYTIVFGVIILLSLSFPVKQQYYIKKFVSFKLLSLFLLIIMVGFRYNVGADYNSYVNYFENLNVNNPFDYSKFEPAYTFINYIIKQNGWGVEIVFLVSAFITLFFVYKTLNSYSKIYSFSLFLFLVDGGYSNICNLVRQGVAISLFFFSVKYIIEKKFYIYVFLIVIASLFHYSALFLIPVYFIADYNFSRKIYFFIYFISLLFLFTNIIYYLADFISPFLFDYGRYLESEYFTRVTQVDTGLGFLFHNIVGIILIFFKNKIVKKDDKNIYFFNLYFISLCTNLIFYRVYILLRMVKYFTWFKFLVLDKFILCFNKNSRKIVLFLIFILYYIIFMYTVHTGSHISPYKFYFN